MLRVLRSALRYWLHPITFLRVFFCPVWTRFPFLSSVVLMSVSFIISVIVSVIPLYISVALGLPFWPIYIALFPLPFPVTVIFCISPFLAFEAALHAVGVLDIHGRWPTIAKNIIGCEGVKK